MGIDIENAVKIAEYLWEHPIIFDNYIQDSKLKKDESDIVHLWKDHNIKGKFYIVKYLKDGAIFLSTDKEGKPYLVKGLVNSFENMWPKYSLPYLIETVLLPFEGAITTSRLYYGSNISFGANISRDIREASQQAELTFGLILEIMAPPGRCISE